MNTFASHFSLREIPVLLRGEPQAISGWMQGWKAERTFSWLLTQD